jgi:hypothetical protein
VSACQPLVGDDPFEQHDHVHVARLLFTVDDDGSRNGSPSSLGIVSSPLRGLFGGAYARPAQPHDRAPRDLSAGDLFDLTQMFEDARHARDSGDGPDRRRASRARLSPRSRESGPSVPALFLLIKVGVWAGQDHHHQRRHPDWSSCVALLAES